MLAQRFEGHKPDGISVNGLTVTHDWTGLYILERTTKYDSLDPYHFYDVSDGNVKVFTDKKTSTAGLLPIKRYANFCKYRNPATNEIAYFPINIELVEGESPFDRYLAAKNGDGNYPEGFAGWQANGSAEAAENDNQLSVNAEELAAWFTGLSLNNKSTIHQEYMRSHTNPPLTPGGTSTPATPPF